MGEILPQVDQLRCSPDVNLVGGAVGAPERSGDGVDGGPYLGSDGIGRDGAELDDAVGDRPTLEGAPQQALRLEHRPPVGGALQPYHVPGDPARPGTVTTRTSEGPSGMRCNARTVSRPSTGPITTAGEWLTSASSPVISLSTRLSPRWMSEKNESMRLRVALRSRAGEVWST